jgi:hypothetical protein
MIPLEVISLDFALRIVKVIISIVNLVFLLFVFQHLRDLQDNYHSKLYPVFLVVMAGFLLLSILLFYLALTL